MRKAAVVEKITKKKKMGEGGYINSCHVDEVQTRNPSRQATNLNSPPSRSKHTRTGCVGQGWTPSLAYGITTSPFSTGFMQQRVSEFYLPVFMVYGERERETRRQCGYADGLAPPSTGGLNST